jgi:hypothetical protein
MNELVRLDKQNDVAVMTIDNPPVNAIGAGVPEGIAAALDEAEKDAHIRAVVIIGAGRTFVAGADIRELEELAAGREAGAPAMHGLFGRLEDFPKPIIMAIHGNALGGGLELAMAGHYRIASGDAKLGQPEVNLGIIPGAEGTQRLPPSSVSRRPLTCVYREADQREGRTRPWSGRWSRRDRFHNTGTIQEDLRDGAIELPERYTSVRTAKRAITTTSWVTRQPMRRSPCRRPRTGPAYPSKPDRAAGRYRSNRSGRHSAL